MFARLRRFSLCLFLYVLKSIVSFLPQAAFLPSTTLPAAVTLTVPVAVSLGHRRSWTTSRLRHCCSSPSWCSLARFYYMHVTSMLWILSFTLPFVFLLITPWFLIANIPYYLRYRSRLLISLLFSWPLSLCVHSALVLTSTASPQVLMCAWLRVTTAATGLSPNSSQR